MFIMDNKKCDQIYRKKSRILRVVPLVLGDMICATNYGENLCYVSFEEVLAALLLGTPGLGDGSLERGLLGLPLVTIARPCSAPIFFPESLILPDVLGWGPSCPQRMKDPSKRNSEGGRSGSWLGPEPPSLLSLCLGRFWGSTGL